MPSITQRSLAGNLSSAFSSQSDVALLLADYKELVLRYEALSRAVASRPAPSPPQPAPIPAPVTSTAAYSASLLAPAPLHQPPPQTTPDSAAADMDIPAEGAAPQPTEDSQFIQRSEESAVQDLLGSSLEPSSLHGSGAAETQRPAAAAAAAAAAFDPFGGVTDSTPTGAEDGGTAAPAQAALADPFLALERAASAMGPPSSGAQAERDAESELAAFRAELPAAESDDAQQPPTAASATGEPHLGSWTAAAVADRPGRAGADVSSVPVCPDVSSGPEPPVADPAADDAVQSAPADDAGRDAVPGSGATEDPAAWAASWGNDSDDAALQLPTAVAGKPVEQSSGAGAPAPSAPASCRPDDPEQARMPEHDIPDPVQDEAGDPTASAASDQPDGSADGSQKPQTPDDVPQPAADASGDAERHSTVPNGLHAAEADAVRTELAQDDPLPGNGLFAGLDVEAKPGDEGVGEQSNLTQTGSAAAQLVNDEAQKGGF